jgi:hypothetical protein
MCLLDASPTARYERCVITTGSGGWFQNDAGPRGLRCRPKYRNNSMAPTTGASLFQIAHFGLYSSVAKFFGRKRSIRQWHTSRECHQSAETSAWWLASRWALNSAVILLCLTCAVNLPRTEKFRPQSEQRQETAVPSIFSRTINCGMNSVCHKRMAFAVQLRTVLVYTPFNES